jgi:DNA-binding SARP family transcriptional activator
MRVSVLGTLNATYNGKTVTPSAPKLRCVLALLALRHDRVVTTGTLIEELWGTNPPVSALATLQTYVYQLRRTLASAQHGSGTNVLETKPLGYVLHLENDALDKDVFDRLVESARERLAADGVEEALELLNRALEMCSTTPLSDVDPGPVLGALITQTAESVLQALELRVDTRLRLSQHRELISDLKLLIAEHPYHEGFHAKLMISLHRSGRRSEALEVYQTLRRNLREELGIEPSGGLRELQRELLDADMSSSPAADPAPREIPDSRPAPAPAPVATFAPPAHLPPDIADFVGRDAHVREVTGLLSGESGGTALRLVTIAGPAGVGKTTLAVRVAHLVRSRFPDGQFYADLGGLAADPKDPFDVLGGFLRAIGVEEQRLPATQDERTQLFRSRTAECRLLMLLDEAVSAAQVRPLLPGGGTCAVLVTGCSGLSSLAGARHVELDTPSVEECVRLLGALIGEARVAAEPKAAREIVRLCGRLPLAIRTVGAKLGTSPRYPLRKLADRLSGGGRLLAELRFGEFDVAARLAAGFQRLDPEAQETLRMFAKHGAATVTAGQATRILGTDLATAEALIENLAEHRFLRPTEAEVAGETVFEPPGLVYPYVLSQLGAAP